MKLSETMTSALLRLREAQESGEDRTATKKSPTIAALARRGLVEYGELRFGTSYRVLLTEAGRKVAKELRGEDDSITGDPSDYMFPADVERVAKTYPLGIRATGRNPRGVHVSGVVTGYAQFGSDRDGYTTVAEIAQEEKTGGYAMLCEPVQDRADTRKGAAVTNPNQPLTNVERLALAASADRMADEIDNNPNDELQGFQDELRRRAQLLRTKQN